MATLEYICRACDWSTITNRRITGCPRCGGETIRYWDEARDDHDDRLAPEPPTRDDVDDHEED